MKNKTTILPQSRRVKTLLVLPALLIILLIGTVSCGLSGNRFTGFTNLGGIYGANASLGIAAELDGNIYFRSFGGELWYPADLCRWDGEAVEILREDFTGYFLTALDGKIYYTTPDSNAIRRFSPDGTDEFFAAYGEGNRSGNGIMPLWTDGEYLYCVDSHSVGILSIDGTIEKQVELPENAYYTSHNFVQPWGASEDRFIYNVRGERKSTPWMLDLSTGESMPLTSDTSASYSIFGVRDGKFLVQRTQDGRIVLLDGKSEKELFTKEGIMCAGDDHLIFYRNADNLYLETEEGEKRIAEVHPNYPIYLDGLLIFYTGQPADLDGTDTHLTAFCTPSPEDNRFIYAADGEGNLYLLHSANTADETP